MEAFVDPNVRDGVLYVPAPPPPVQPSRAPPAVPSTNAGAGGKARAARRQSEKVGAGVYGAGAGGGEDAAGLLAEIKRKGVYLYDEEGLDPFRGF